MRYGESPIAILRRMRAWILLRSFDGSPTSIYRAVHALRDNEFFFADYARDFFVDVHKLLAAKKVVEVRRVIVYHSDAELLEERSKRIIQFHSNSPGYQCRLVEWVKYEQILASSNIAVEVDFGIFGARRVFRARTDRRDLIVGSWSARKAEVARFIRVFEDLWDAGRSAMRPADGCASIVRLFEVPGNGAEAQKL